MRILEAVVWAMIISAGDHSERTTDVEMWKGLPTFMIDGEPHMSTSFETYVPDARRFRQMSEAGATVFGFATNCGESPYWHSTPVWAGPGVWNYTEFDETVAKILEANPDALLMPRINVSEPEWWREANPDELMVFDDGTTAFREPYRLWPAKESRTIASLASEKWRNDMSDSLRRMIAHIQASPYADRIFGYQIFSQATEEWYHYASWGKQLSDYSIHMRKAFQDWLRRKYGTEENLRSAWRRDISFDAARIPSREERLTKKEESAFRNPETETPTIDFYTFYNEIIPETIDLFCRVVKEETGGSKAVGAFYAYLFEFVGNPDSGHVAVQKLLQSSHVDFIVVTASYGSRHLGSGGSILRSPHTSLKLHGKLWYEDNDTVSFLFPEVAKRIGDYEWERNKVDLAATDTAEESKWIYERGAGFVLGNGIYQSLFDLHGGYFDHPDLLQTVSGIYRTFRESAKYDRTSVSEILLVADERSVMYNAIRTPLHREAVTQLPGQNLYDPPYRLIKCGAPYDSVYLNDLALLDTAPYKLIIMLNTYCMDDAQVKLVSEKVKQAGKTVLWIYGPGMFDGGETTLDRPSVIAGMNLEIYPFSHPTPPRIVLKQNTGVFVDRLVSEGLRILGPEAPGSGPAFVTDSTAQSLGCDAETGKTTLARKERDGWVSVYSVTASLPSAFYRELAREAGVHIYNDRNDTLYVSNSYLTVNADGEGVRNLEFREKVNLYDPVTDEPVTMGVRSYPLPLRDKETRIVRIERLSESKQEMTP